MATESITSALGAGSGIDLTALVNDLVDAQFAARTDRLEAKNETLTAQISAVSQLKAGISSFSTALTTLARSGTLSTQPTTSNAALLGVTRQAGADVAGLNTTVEIRQLAAAQVAHTAPVADKTAAIGTGTLTLRFGTASVVDGAMEGFDATGTAIDIAIDPTHASLEGVVTAINAAGAGVTASILSDADGARLVLKGPTGAEKAFTLTATEDAAAPGLAALSVGVGASGTRIGSPATDAIVAIDGIAVRRQSNSITDLVPGVQLDLATAQPGTIVRLGTTPPTDTLRQAVSDVVDAYNEMLSMLQQQTDPVTGSLRSDTGARALARGLSALTLVRVLPSDGSGAPTTLADLGVSTQRDGTLAINSERFEKMLATYPRQVEAMFATGTGATEHGLPAALAAIADAATSKTTGLAASEARYTAQQEAISDDRSDALSSAEAMRTRMTQQFARMDAKVAAYRATETFLEQQIDAWNQA